MAILHRQLAIGYWRFLRAASQATSSAQHKIGRRPFWQFLSSLLYSQPPSVLTLPTASSPTASAFPAGSASASRLTSAGSLLPLCQLQTVRLPAVTPTI